MSGEYYNKDGPFEKDAIAKECHVVATRMGFVVHLGEKLVIRSRLFYPCCIVYQSWLGLVVLSRESLSSLLLVVL